MDKNKKQIKKYRIHFSVLIFFVCLLFTVIIWDHYLHSDSPLDRGIVSNLVLMMGVLFSAAAGLFTWSLERSHGILETEVELRTHDLRQRNESLEKALKEIKTLRGLLPVCASCKKIRDDTGYWHEMETYFQKHSEVAFSHGLCSTCMETLYPDRMKP